MRTIIATVVLAAVAAGQSMTAPRLGHVFDASGKSIRPVTGVPGATALEPALVFIESLDSAYVSAAGNLAIARSKEGAVLVLSWNDSPSALPLDSAPPDLSGAAFSPSGKWAVLFGRSGAVQRWSLPAGTPALSGQWALDSTPLAAAVNDDGAIAVATSANTLVSVAAGQIRVIGSGDFRGLAFAGADQVIASDAQTNRILRIRTADASFTEIAGATDLLAPGALAISADSNMLAVANTGASEIALIDLTSSAIQHVACACRPERFDALQGSTFHIVDSTVDFILLLDGQNARISQVQQ